MERLGREPVHLPPITIGPSFIDLTSLDLKVGLYFWRSQAPLTPPRSALVRGIRWRVPIGVSMRKRLSKKYKPTRVHKRWQKLNDFQDITGLNNLY